MESVDLSWCISLTDKGVCKLAAACPHLSLLSLHGLRGITDVSINALAANCSETLHTLDVHGCVGVKASSQAELKLKLPNLVSFLVHT